MRSQFFQKNLPELDLSYHFDGAPSVVIDDIHSLKHAKESHLSFYHDHRYKSHMAACKAAACLVPRGLSVPSSYNGVIIECDDVLYELAQIIQCMYTDKKPITRYTSCAAYPGVFIGPHAKIGRHVRIEPGVVIGQEAVIGDGSYLHSGCVIGAYTRIGERCIIGEHSCVRYAHVGNDTVIGAHGAIGNAGFAFTTDKYGHHHDTMQVGWVCIEDNVRIGTHVVIDRGALEATHIGHGTRIDSHTLIAHNVHIGRHVCLAGGVGLAGSVRIDDHAVLGGQVGVAGHIHIGARAQIAAKSGVMQSIKEGAVVAGSPALPIMQWRRMYALMRQATQKSSQKKS